MKSKDESSVETVAVVDDHEVVGLAVETLLSTRDDLEFAGYSASVPQLLRTSDVADLVLLDLNLRDGSTPTENITALKSWGARVLILTAGEQPFLTREAARHGVLGVIRKSASAATMLDMISRAAKGDAVLTPEWASALEFDEFIDSVNLTAREQEVLALYASGMSAQAVAATLFISENTVEDHLRRVRRAYSNSGREASSKVALYRRSLEDGILPLPTTS